MIIITTTRSPQTGPTEGLPRAPELRNLRWAQSGPVIGPRGPARRPNFRAQGDRHKGPADRTPCLWSRHVQTVATSASVTSLSATPSMQRCYNTKHAISLSAIRNRQKSWSAEHVCIIVCYVQADKQTTLTCGKRFCIGDWLHARFSTCIIEKELEKNINSVNNIAS